MVVWAESEAVALTAAASSNARGKAMGEAMAGRGKKSIGISRLI